MRAIGDWAPEIGRFDSSWSVCSSREDNRIRFIDILQWRQDSTPDYPYSFAVWREFGFDTDEIAQSEVWDPVGSYPPIIEWEDSDDGGYELLDLGAEHTVLVTRGVEDELDPRILQRILSVQDALERDFRDVEYGCELELRFGRYSQVLFSLEVVLVVTDPDSGSQRRITVGRRESADWFTPYALNLEGSDWGWRELLHLDEENFRADALTDSISMNLPLHWMEPLGALWDSRFPLRHKDFQGLDHLGSNPVKPSELPGLYDLLGRSINAIGVEGEEPPIGLSEPAMAAHAVTFPARGTLVNPLDSLASLVEVFRQESPTELRDALLNTYELSDDAIQADQEFAWSSWNIAFSEVQIGENAFTGEGLCFSVFATEYEHYRTAEFFFDTEPVSVYGTPDPSDSYGDNIEQSPEIPGTRYWNPDRHSQDTGLFELASGAHESPRVAFAVILRTLRSSGFDYRKTRLKLLTEVVSANEKNPGHGFG